MAAPAEAERTRKVMSEAAFQGLQVHNELDRVLVCRHLAEAWYLIGDPRRAETLALEGLALGERHSTFGPSFNLSCLLAELYWRQGKTGRAGFFWEEARHIIGLGLPGQRLDLAVHHFLGAELGLGKVAGDTGEAGRLMAAELAEIDNEDGRKILRGFRCYGEIIKLV